MDLIADPGPALNSASSVKGPDTMFPYPPPGYFLTGKKHSGAKILVGLNCAT